MFLPDGTPAPPFFMTAEVNGRAVDLQSQAGALLLIFLSYQTTAEVGNVTRAVREIYPSPDQVLIVGIADMRIVPRLLRGTAKAFIKSAYKEAASEVPAGEDPADHILILADWDGALYEAYRAPLTDGQVALVLVNDVKEISGSYYGAQAAQAALTLLEHGYLSANE